jgi:hypothetical protein
MAYKKGQVEYGDCGWSDGPALIHLPHSCDEWIIGGKKEAEQLIKDLEKIIKKLPN